MRIIFVHGSGAWGGIWHKQLRFFPQAEAVTLPGHPDGRPREAVTDYADWLYGLIRGGPGYQKVLLVGHSLGGAIAMNYALKHAEDLAGLVLVSTGARLKTQRALLDEVEAAVQGDADEWLARLKLWLRRLPPEERDGIIARVREIGPRAMHNDLLVCDSFDVMNVVHNIRIPALVVSGQADLLPQKFADYLARTIPGARQETIRGAGHFAMLEKPDEFNRILDDFAALLDPKHATP